MVDVKRLILLLSFQAAAIQWPELFKDGAESVRDKVLEDMRTVRQHTHTLTVDLSKICKGPPPQLCLPLGQSMLIRIHLPLVVTRFSQEIC